MTVDEAMKCCCGNSCSCEANDHPHILYAEVLRLRSEAKSYRDALEKTAIMGIEDLEELGRCSCERTPCGFCARLGHFRSIRDSAALSGPGEMG